MTHKSHSFTTLCNFFNCDSNNGALPQQSLLLKLNKIETSDVSERDSCTCLDRHVPGPGSGLDHLARALFIIRVSLETLDKISKHFKTVRGWLGCFRGCRGNPLSFGCGSGWRLTGRERSRMVRTRGLQEDAQVLLAHGICHHPGVTHCSGPEGGHPAPQPPPAAGGLLEGRGPSRAAPGPPLAPLSSFSSSSPDNDGGSGSRPLLLLLPTAWTVGKGVGRRQGTFIATAGRE